MNFAIKVHSGFQADLLKKGRKAEFLENNGVLRRKFLTFADGAQTLDEVLRQNTFRNQQGMLER
ncbi:MAG: hypothetical protein NXI16_06790 [Alphaproteobacteria bacterium]|nr:hypothetical protein [Alphaproteobacteria bacterium]